MVGHVRSAPCMRRRRRFAVMDYCCLRGSAFALLLWTCVYGKIKVEKKKGWGLVGPRHPFLRVVSAVLECSCVAGLHVVD